MNYPLDKNLVDNVCRAFGLMDAHELSNATIRQMVGIVREIERQADCEYVLNCVHLVSCSKIFSYAGERAAVIAVHPDLAHRHSRTDQSRLGFHPRVSRSDYSRGLYRTYRRFDAGLLCLGYANLAVAAG